MRVVEEQHQPVRLRQAHARPEVRPPHHLSWQRPDGVRSDRLRENGGVPAAHPAAADGGRRGGQPLQRDPGARGRDCGPHQGAHQPDLPGGAEVRLWVSGAVRGRGQSAAVLALTRAASSQDVRAACGGLRGREHRLPDEGDPEGLQRSVRDSGSSAGHDRQRKGERRFRLTVWL